MKRRERNLLLLLVIGCVCAGVYTVGRHLLPLAAEWLDVGVAPARVDAVMTLAGEPNTRPYTAADIFNAGCAETAIVTETVDSPDVQDGLWPASDVLNRRVLTHCGVPDERIVTIGHDAASTADEADALADYLADRPGIRVAVVTNAFHTRRARWVFARRLGPDGERISFVSAPNRRFQTGRWWETEDGFRCVTSEYAKLVYYWCRYGSGVIWITAFGAGAVTLLVVCAVRRG